MAIGVRSTDYLEMRARTNSHLLPGTNGKCARTSMLVTVQVGSADAASAQTQTHFTQAGTCCHIALNTELQRAVQGASQTHEILRLGSGSAGVVHPAEKRACDWIRCPRIAARAISGLCNAMASITARCSPTALTRPSWPRGPARRAAGCPSQTHHFGCVGAADRQFDGRDIGALWFGKACFQFG